MFFYCSDCRKVYACDCNGDKLCQECKNLCHMFGKTWKRVRFTYLNDNHKGKCNICEGE
jgi:hypothetical protein